MNNYLTIKIFFNTNRGSPPPKIFDESDYNEILYKTSLVEYQDKI